MMKVPAALAVAATVFPSVAAAAFHLWDITEVYSSADGSVQYVELFTTNNNQDELINHLISSGAVTYVFPTDLDPDGTGEGNGMTANRHFLIATPAFAAQPGAVTPDFVFEGPNFFDVIADTVNFSDQNSFTWTSGELPTDGVNSLNEPFGSDVRTTASNSPTNFAGEVGSLVPADLDSDGDGMPDSYESSNNLDPNDPGDAANDNDNDGLNNLGEFTAGTNPNNRDSDGDGLIDGNDLQPVVASNVCAGEAAVLENLVVLGGTTVQCAAAVSIEVLSTLNAESGARIELFAPTVRFQPEFALPAGAELEASVDNSQLP